MKTFSIALCTYNGERFLSEQLESFTRQSRLPDELVICDDASQDGTIQLINDFIERAPFTIRLYRNDRNIGYIRNFEQAVSLCHGDFIAFSDQDDVWFDDRLAKFEQIFLSDPMIGYAFCNAMVVNEELQNLNYTLWDKYGVTRKKQKKYLPGEFTKVLLWDLNFLHGCLMVASSDIIKMSLPFPELWSHDDWIPFSGSIFKSVVMMPDLLIKYRLNTKQCFGLPLTPKKTSRKRYLSLIKPWEIAFSRISNDDRLRKYRSILFLIDGKIQHLRARGQMPNNFLKRLPIVFREIISRHYFRYSSGLKSAARDLLLYE